MPIDLMIGDHVTLRNGRTYEVIEIVKHCPHPNTHRLSIENTETKNRFQRHYRSTGHSVCKIKCDIIEITSKAATQGETTMLKLKSTTVTNNMLEFTINKDTIGKDTVVQLANGATLRVQALNSNAGTFEIVFNREDLYVGSAYKLFYRLDGTVVRDADSTAGEGMRIVSYTSVKTIKKEDGLKDSKTDQYLKYFGMLEQEGLKHPFVFFNPENNEFVRHSQEYIDKYMTVLA